MLQEHTETEYHLTPHGWLKGSFWVDCTKTEDVPVPSDRVETCVGKDRRWFRCALACHFLEKGLGIRFGHSGNQDRVTSTVSAPRIQTPGEDLRSHEDCQKHKNAGVNPSDFCRRWSPISLLVGRSCTKQCSVLLRTDYVRSQTETQDGRRVS
jgi:hypothetical protein